MLTLLGLWLGGCGAANTPAEHTGRFIENRPIIALGSCCVGYDPVAPVYPVFAVNPKQPSLWRPVVDKQGKPHPPGHVDDAYFTGEVPRRSNEVAPSGYRYTPPATERIDLRALYPGLRRVHFPEFETFDEGGLTADGSVALNTWMRAHYGAASTISKLGEGGFAMAYRICPKPSDCRVAKIRKILPSFAEWRRIKLAAKATNQLKRDLVVFEIARRVAAGARYLGPDGKPAPFVIGAQVITSAPTRPRVGEPGCFVRVAPPINHKMLQEGVIDQELISLHASPALLARLAAARPAGSRARIDAYAALSAGSAVTEADIRQFFDAYTRLKGIGPEVAKVNAFSRACRRLAAVPPIASLCLDIRRDLQIPDDFEERVRALEQLYRDSAAMVMRFSRKNFGRALGNTAADKLMREIGLDYNHGRNAGWDGRTRQFVIFDC